MIPSSVEADTVELEALVSEWRLEVISTNWAGYWIVQLSRKSFLPLAMLFDLNALAALCRGLRECINAIRSGVTVGNAKSMSYLVAADLPTQTNSDGAVQLLASWKSTPVISIGFYRDRQESGKNVIRQHLHVDDASDYLLRFERVYNEMSNKEDWRARLG